MKQRQIPESQIVNACLRWLWLHGCYVWRNNSGAWKPEGADRYIHYGTPGSADIIGVTRCGRFIAVEAKTLKGKLSPLQEVFKERVEDHNGIFILARSIDDLELRKAEIKGDFFYPRHKESVSQPSQDVRGQ